MWMIGRGNLYNGIRTDLNGAASDVQIAIGYLGQKKQILDINLIVNHFGKKKFTVDPTPMEVEMRLYENDIQTPLIETYSRKERELHVDQTDSSCGHRK